MSELVCKPFGAWQVGDTVRCVDARGSADRLVYGSTYTIGGIDAECSRISLDRDACYWNSSRFEFVAPEVEPPTVAAQNPYADWKSGDSLRCIEATGSHEMLCANHIYEIENGPFSKSGKDRISLVGLSGYEWNCNRFERVSPIVDVHSEPDKPVVRVGSRVRCDDASGSGTPWIVLGEIYTVSAIDEQEDGIFIGVDGSGAPSWRLSRFRLLPDEVAPSVPVAQADQWDEATRGKKMSSATGRVIYKYQMPVMEHFTMQLPAGAEIIRMDGIDGMFWLWAVVDTNAADETRKFHAVKCGGNMPDIANLKYVGCCAVFVQQELMLYIFEEVSNA